jgi:hypothetical protein
MLPSPLDFSANRLGESGPKNVGRFGEKPSVVPPAKLHFPGTRVKTVKTYRSIASKDEWTPSLAGFVFWCVQKRWRGGGGREREGPPKEGRVRKGGEGGGGDKR